MRVSGEIQLRRSPLDLGQQQMLNGIEAEQAPLDRLAHRPDHLWLREVLEQTQHLDIFPLPGAAKPRLEMAQQGVEGGIQLPAP